MDWQSPTPYIAITAVVAVMALGRLIYRSRIEKAEKNAEWKGQTDESVSNLKTTLTNIENYLRKLLERGLKEVAVDQSPKQLNEFGEAVSEHLGAKDWAREEANKLQPDLQGMEPFEFYEGSQQHVQNDSKFSTEFKRKMRETAYEKNVEMIQIRAVLAIELRDALVKILAD